LGQGGQRAGRGIAEGAQRRQQHGQEDVDPLIGFTLAHAEQASLDDLEGVSLEVGEEEEQALFQRRSGTVLVHRKPAGGPGFSIEAPRRHMRLERRLEGRDQDLKLLESEAGHIQERRGARLHIDTPQTGHKGSLLLLEVQYTTNRDKLK
jgi:hypothetical protein